MDLTDLTATELAAVLARGEASSVEVTRAFLDRIERLDRRVGAFVTLRGQALGDAARRDAERKAATGPLPPLHGVPTGVKDLDIVGGGFTRFGTRGARWFWWPFDGPVARRLRAGGLVLVGKTATSELGAMPITETDIGPPTRNPWNLERSAGGSSGGSAAAVAARMLPVAQGSDGGGSIRIPAALTGLYGYKPSRARMPDFYGKADPFDMAYVGPLAHTVEDAVLLADVLAGDHAPPDPAWRTPPGRRRVRYHASSLLGLVDPAIAAAVHRVATVLADLGHDVEEAAVPPGDLDEFLPVWQRQLAAVAPFPPPLAQPVTRWLHEGGARVRHADAVVTRDALRVRAAEWFGEADLWLTPTVPVATPRVGESAGLDAEATFRWAAHLGANTAIFNLTGQPAASVPAGFTPDGMPIGAQLVGRHGGDALVLAVSAQLEAAMPWRGQRPPL